MGIAPLLTGIGFLVLTLRLPAEGAGKADRTVTRTAGRPATTT
jgi:hypothetical protein